MKRVFLTLNLLLAFAVLQAQKNSIIGIWIFPVKAMFASKTLVEFTETQFMPYGINLYEDEKLNYKIVDGNKLFFNDDETPVTLKWKGKNKLILSAPDTEDEKSVMLTRVIPNRKKPLMQGSYIAKFNGNYVLLNILPDGNAEFGSLRRTQPVKYLTEGSNFYLMTCKDYYTLFKIKNSKTLQFVEPACELIFADRDYKILDAMEKKKIDCVFKWISDEELQLLRARAEAEPEADFNRINAAGD